jgi:hypothetical protein
MAEWILILTLSGGFHGNFAMHSVPAFKTEAACNEAAKRWKETLPAVRLGNTQAAAICVRSS